MSETHPAEPTDDIPIGDGIYEALWSLELEFEFEPEPPSRESGANQVERIEAWLSSEPSGPRAAALGILKEWHYPVPILEKAVLDSPVEEKTLKEAIEWGRDLLADNALRCYIVCLASGRDGIEESKNYKDSYTKELEEIRTEGTVVPQKVDRYLSFLELELPELERQCLPREARDAIAVLIKICGCVAKNGYQAGLGYR